MMERRLAERRKELTDMREQQAIERGEKILDPEVVDQILERASSALVQQLQADAFDEEAELARLRAEIEASDEYNAKQAGQQRKHMMEKLDARKAAIRARQQSAREAQQDREEAARQEEGVSPEDIPRNEVALIISKVEENVIDACDANAEAAKILADFNIAETDREKHSAESRLLKKQALQKRLADRREAAIAAQAQAMQSADENLDKETALEQANEAMQLNEKWQDVEDDLVEQALCTYEIELQHKSEEEGAASIDARAQEAALARVMWQLHRDIAHAEELRSNEWASSEAANILKRYEQASKQAETEIAEAQTEAKIRLKQKLERRQALRLKQPPKKPKSAGWKRVDSEVTVRRANRIWRELERKNTSENLAASYDMSI